MSCSCGCTGTNEITGNTYENLGYCFEQDWEAPCMNPYGDSAYKRKDTASSCPCVCTLVPCANVELCGVKQPGWCYYNGAWGSTSQYGNLCRHCDGMRFNGIFEVLHSVPSLVPHQPWQRLEFKDATEPCSVCFEQKDRVVKFPHCTHYFCIDCTWAVLYGHGELDYHLSPVPYGCSPCPNGCVNPVQGVQCGCMEYSNNDDDEGPLGVVQQWAVTNPEAYEAYNVAEIASIDAGNHPVYGSGKCPLCRSSYP